MTQEDRAEGRRLLEVDTPRSRCGDYDEDCYGIEDKVHCYLYDPTRGMCPFLSSHSKDIQDPTPGASQ